ncbi:DUF4145 domain-containing protein [Candidatus Gracilibacteria bacterium]|nr:DUF4145 domain-containing protein [Candidatus Gracilibacteria bacterium]MCF7819725.1 DUF4145 domain-containing protein [Candidatus Gracilibacteria bacterium]
MTQKDNTILLNFNRFGPSFTEEEEKWLLTKPARKTIEDHLVNFRIKPLEEFLSKTFYKIKVSEIKRYCEITDKDTHTSITPSQDYAQLTSRIIQPIILGKKYFTLGEYVSCIAMAGLAAEMMTLVVWNMSEFSVAGKVLNDEEQKVLFGRIDQERRIKLLRLTNAIQDDDQKMLEEIRNIRNNYTHSWDVKSTQDKGNAKKVIRYALILFKNISGIDLYIDKNRKQQLKVNPRFLQFLKSKDSSQKTS